MSSARDDDQRRGGFRPGVKDIEHRQARTLGSTRARIATGHAARQLEHHDDGATLRVLRPGLDAVGWPGRGEHRQCAGDQEQELRSEPLSPTFASEQVGQERRVNGTHPGGSTSTPNERPKCVDRARNQAPEQLRPQEMERAEFAHVVLRVGMVGEAFRARLALEESSHAPNSRSMCPTRKPAISPSGR